MTLPTARPTTQPTIQPADRRRRFAVPMSLLAAAALAGAGVVATIQLPRAGAQPAPATQPDVPPVGSVGQPVVTASGLTIIERGRTDLAAKAGDSVSVHYTGRLQDGTVFDSTSNRGNQPFTFTLGAHKVIAGWDEGVVGMHIGQHRTLIIPGKLAYGDKGFPPTIPANATLTFDVDVTAIEPGHG